MFLEGTEEIVDSVDHSVVINHCHNIIRKRYACRLSSFLLIIYYGSTHPFIVILYLYKGHVPLPGQHYISYPYFYPPHHIMLLCCLCVLILFARPLLFFTKAHSADSWGLAYQPRIYPSSNF